MDLDELRERLRAMNPQKDSSDVWISREGKVYNISEMTDEHVKNALNRIIIVAKERARQAGSPGWQLYIDVHLREKFKRLVAEAQERGLIDPGEI